MKIRKFISTLLVLLLSIGTILIPTTTKGATVIISLNYATVTNYTGKAFTLRATIKNTNNTVKWKTSNSTVCSISTTSGSSTKVSLRKAGTAIITATVAGKSATCRITVRQLVTSLKLSATSTTVYTGSTTTLKATISPSNATNKAIKWTTSNSNVATVSSTGIVKGVKAGTVTITASTKDGSNKTASCKVIVRQKATAISLSPATLTLYTGRSTNIKVNFKPIDTSIRTVNWKTSNSSVATVSSTGVVKGIKPGSAIITATTKDGTNLSANCMVTVKQYVTSIKLSETDLTLDFGKTTQLTATVSPANATEKGVSWSVNNKGVVSITQTGEIKTLGLGTAIVTATAIDGSKVSASCKVTVVQKVTNLKLNKTSIRLNKNNNYSLTPTITPTNATNKNLKWTTSDSNIATVSNGVVSAVGIGTATITATTTDGSNLSASCKVTVIQYPTAIVLSKTELKLVRSDKEVGTTINATLFPADTTERELIWSSDNEKVARVDNTGKITTVGNGNCNITVTSKVDKSVKAICKVNVTTKANSIKINRTTATINTGKTVTLKTVVYPADTSNKTIIWTTSNNKVASVQRGVVIGNTKGTCIITGTSSSNPNLIVKCKIYVRQSAVNMLINKTSLVISKGKNFTLKATVYPTDTYNKRVRWTSSNNKIATVNSKGVVTAKAKGSCTITTTSYSNSKLLRKCTVTVKQLVTSIRMNKNKLTLNKNSRYKLKVGVYPRNANNRSVLWKSYNTKVATVTQSGIVTAKEKGTASIRAIARDGSRKYARCKVTVRQPVTGIGINYSNASLYVGTTFTLKANIYPQNANNKGVRWYSTNSTVAKVTSGGRVTATGKGNCKIYGQSKENSKFRVVCNVTVKQAVAPSPYFRSYSLSDTQIRRIASLCYQEQGSIAGATAEASLMANLYELTGQTGSIYNFIQKGGWWANAPYYMSKECKNEKVVKAVKLALCYGRRTLPKYIDEHDCLGDITYQSTPNYIRHKTVIKNCYGSTYTFYSFPATGSDPFGYTSKENRKKYGDFCYKFSDLNI